MNFGVVKKLFGAIKTPLSADIVPHCCVPQPNDTVLCARLCSDFHKEFVRPIWISFQYPFLSKVFTRIFCTGMMKFLVVRRVRILSQSVYCLRHVRLSVCLTSCIGLAPSGWIFVKSDIGDLWKYIPIYIQQDATLHSLLYLETAVHVSGGTSTHHQGRIQLYLQHLVFVRPLLLPADIVEELELVGLCSGWYATHNTAAAREGPVYSLQVLPR